MEAEITCIAPWFGSNRMLATHVAAELAACNWVAIPFAGGMSEVLQLTARTILVNDIHLHVMNLAMSLADEEAGPQIYRALRRVPFHPVILDQAQKIAATWLETADRQKLPDPFAAIAYFISVWMARSGNAGTKAELRGGLAIRWEAGGGDSATRYRSAVRSIVNWRKALTRCTFHTLDAYTFLERCHDAPGHGIYCDPPFFDTGDKYRHSMTTEQHEQLATRLATFQQTKVVIRFYDHPEVRRLYPADRWTFKELDGRKQTNAAAAELLLINRRET